MRTLIILLFSIVTTSIPTATAIAAPTTNANSNLMDYPAAPINDQIIRSALQKSSLHLGLEIIPGSQSDEYAWLNNDSVKRTEFLAHSENEFKQKHSKNAQFEAIYNFLDKNNPQADADEFTVTLSETHKIVVSRTANYVRTWYDIDGETKTPLLSSNDFLPNKAGFVGLYPSADKSYVAAQVSLNGNIDNVELIVYSVKEKKIVFRSEVTSWLEDTVWSSDSEIYYTHPASNSQGTTLIVHDFKSGQKRNLYNHGPLSFESWAGYEDYATQNVFLKNVKTGQHLYYKNLSTTDFVAETKDSFFFKTNGHSQHYGKILKLAKVNEAEPTVFVDRKDGFYMSSFRTLKDGNFLIERSRDSQIFLSLINKDQKVLAEVILPLNATLSGIETTDSTAYQLTISYYGTSNSVLWNPATDINFDEMLKKSLKYDDVEVVSRIEYFRSTDGEMIPARIVHKKDLVMDANRPVFMEAYGGFNLMGYLGANLSKTKQEFVKRGGIYVGTGVRGGAERGYTWYKNGSGQTEQNTTLDVIGIANGLIERGYTKSEKIVLTGGSNGGYVVANAALTSPESFGLVIPLNGVQDQLDFPNLDRWGLGWMSEYLNPFEPADLKKILIRAPLELSPLATKKPYFLIINGENDSRVNKVHSYKLKAKLDQLWPNHAVLYSVKNAGHWATSPYLLDDVGLKAAAVMWSHIYEHVELKF